MAAGVCNNTRRRRDGNHLAGMSSSSSDASGADHTKDRRNGIQRDGNEITKKERHTHIHLHSPFRFNASGLSSTQMVFRAGPLSHPAISTFPPIQFSLPKIRI